MTPPQFIFRIHSCHRDPLSREVCEAVMIQQVCKSENVLNSKSEWNSAPLSRLTLELPEWKKKQKLNELEAQTLREKEKATTFKKMKKSSSFDHALRKLNLYQKFESKNGSNKAGKSPTHITTNKVSSPGSNRGTGSGNISSEIFVLVTKIYKQNLNIF